MEHAGADTRADTRADTSQAPSDGPHAVGRRERKKAKTRAAIEGAALELFRRYGYESTTVEEVAAASDVSLSTLFRYFPTKADLVLPSDYDPFSPDRLGTLPEGASTVELARAAVGDLLRSMSDDELSELRVRAAIVLAVPELRGVVLERLAGNVRAVVELAVDRAGRNAEEFPLQAAVGAIIGVVLSAHRYWTEHLGTDLLDLVDEGLRQVDEGLSRLDGRRPAEGGG